MNISFILPEGMRPGGVKTWSVEMSQRLVELGNSVYLVEHCDQKRTPKITIDSKVNWLRCIGEYPFFLSNEETIADYLLTYEKVLPSIIIPNWSVGTYATCAAIAQNNPEAVRVIGFAHSDEDAFYDLLTYYEPMIARFVAVSQEIKVKLQQRIPHRARDILLRPYAVNVDTNSSRDYSSGDKPLRLVYAGRLQEKQKRVSDLIKLAQILENKKVNFELQIVGDGPSLGSLTQQVQSFQTSLQNRIHFTGKLPYHRIPAIFKSADICVMVSAFEGTSIAMLEAMASGCIPVVTRVSGTSAVINPGENGYLAELGDLEQMAQIIQQLEADRDQLNRLGVNAHRLITQNYSYQEYMDWFLKMIAESWESPLRRWPQDRALIPSWQMNNRVGIKKIYKKAVQHISNLFSHTRNVNND